MSQTIDVFGVGNAMVDILVMIPDTFLVEHELAKGAMTLVDAQLQGKLLNALEQRKPEVHSKFEMQSGGSAANTVIAVAQSGGSAFYTGKVAGDPNGEFYRRDMCDSGVDFDVLPAPEAGAPTGSCLVLTTPDAERTMCTHLGVSTQLSPTDINLDRLKRCKFSYIEGYLWDPSDPRAASLQVMEESRRHNIKVAFTFSDPFVVNRFADDFRGITREYCDLVFCNADEVRQFAETESFETAAKILGERVNLVFATNGAEGCLVVDHGKLTHVPGFAVDAIDTVGAGDAFAGGVLYGLAHGYSAPQAARWGNYLASRVVTLHGARLPDAIPDQVAKVLG